ncbi:MAG: serine/threonine-protein kinase [Planctomycetota bacterium]
MVADRFASSPGQRQAANPLAVDDITIDDAFASILADWIDAVDRGETPSVDAFIARHPQHASRLRQAIETWVSFNPIGSDVDSQKGGKSSVSLPNRQLLPLPEHVSIGDYEVKEVIGSGGMAVVYKARQRSLGRDVALKVLRGTAAANKIDLDRFRFEANTIAKLDHPNVVSIHEVVTNGDTAFFSMQWIDGCNLMQYLSAIKDQPMRVAKILQKTSLAVHHAHQRGVLHRDLKPSNILIDSEGDPHVTDFGLAKSIHVDGDLTQPGFLVGTPNYMAPEQTLPESDASAISVATDIHGLGSVLYTVLAGHPPFESRSVLTTLARIREREPASLKHVNTSVPRDLESICFRCLQKRPEDRYASALDLANDLGRFIDGQPVRARPVATWRRGVRWAGRNRVTTFLAVSALALLIALIVNSMAGHRQTRKALAQANSFAEEQSRRTQELKETLHLALAGMTETLPRVSQASRSGQYGPEQTAMLQRMLSVFESLVEESRSDAHLKLRAINAYERVASLKHLLGDRTGAIEAQTRALDLLSELTSEPDAKAKNKLLHRRIMAMTDLVHLLIAAGDYTRAQGVFEKAEAMLFAEPSERPLVSEDDSILVRVPSESHYFAAHALVAGSLLSELRGNYTDSRRLALEALRLARSLRSDSSASSASRAATLRLLMRTHQQVGDISLRVQDLDSATKHLEKTAELAKQFERTHDFDVDVRPQLIESYYNLASSIAIAGESEDALEVAIAWNRKAVECCESLVAENTEASSYSQLLARCYHELAKHQFIVGDRASAKWLRNRANELFQSILSAQPDEMVARASWANMLASWSTMLRRHDQHEQASDVADHCRQTLQEILEREDRLGMHVTASDPHLVMGHLYAEAGELRSAAREFDKRIRRLERNASRGRDTAHFSLRKAETLLMSARTHRLLDEPEIAGRKLEAATLVMSGAEEHISRHDRSHQERHLFLRAMVETEGTAQLIGVGDIEGIVRKADRFVREPTTWVHRFRAADLYAHAAWMIEQGTELPDSEKNNREELLSRAKSLIDDLLESMESKDVQKYYVAWLLVAHANPDFLDPHRALELIDYKRETLNPSDHTSAVVCGAALYRSGRFEEAAEVLAPVAEQAWRYSLTTPSRVPHAMLLLSMTHASLGNKIEAQEWLESASRWASRLDPSETELKRLRMEAEKVLEFNQ